MSIFIHRTATLALIVCTTGAPAAAQQVPQVRVPPSLFQASWNNRLPTSGGEIMGLMGGDPTARITSPTLIIGGIDARDAVICVSIRQVSGAYSASFQMRNPQAGSTVAFLLPRNKIKIEKLLTAELSVLARVSPGASCSRTSDILPASWVGLAAGPVFALVNNHQADRTRTVSPRGGGDCERLGAILPGRALTSYQMVCRVPQPPANCAPVPLAIELQNAGEVSLLRRSVRRDCR